MRPAGSLICTALALNCTALMGLPTQAQAASAIVQELRQARLARIKGQVFGQPSFDNLMPAAGPAPVNVPQSEPPTPEPVVAQQRSSPVVPVAAEPAPVIVEQPEPPVLIELGGPTPGTTFRNVPVEEPILPTDRWDELLYAIELNGAAMSDGEIVLRSPDGTQFAVEIDLARDWRVRVDPNRIITLSGIPFYPLTGTPGSSVEIDDSRLVLSITLPPNEFEAAEQDLSTPTANLPPPAAALGGFLDYDFVALGGSSVAERIDGLLELGAFSPLGVGLTSVQLNDVSGDIDIIRLESTLTRDFPDQRATLRIGDSITTGGTLTPSARFGGLQWATNFGTDPNFISFPLPTIGGLSEQQSVIEVVSDNVSRVTTQVPAGPFQLGNIPVVTGAGELQVTVTDLLGREQTVTQPYYVSSELLKPGLHDFAYELGFQRQDFGIEGFEYGDPLISTTHRLGVSDGLTLEGHADADLEGAAVTAGGTAMLGGFGVVSGGVGVSGDDDLGGGYLGQVAYDYRRREFNAGIRSRYTSSDYRTIGGVSTVEREDQLNVGFALGDIGRIGLLALNREFHDAETSRSLTGSFSMPLLGGSFLINAAHTLEPETETAVIASFSLPLSRIRSIATTAEHRDGETLGRVQYRRSRDRSDLGLDYRLGAELGDDTKSLDARFGYNFQSVATSLEFEQDDEDGDVRLGMAGSLALVDGKFGLSRPLGRAFGLVDLPGYPDVKVYLDNREAGRTDQSGRLVLPSLRPYQANKVHLAVEDLPFDAKVVAGDVVAVPFDGAGMKVPLTIGGGRSAIAVLIDRAGAPLPAGLLLASLDGLTTGQVAREGLSQLDGMGTHATQISGSLGGQQFVCSLQGLALNGEPFPDLGTIQCGS